MIPALTAVMLKAIPRQPSPGLVVRALTTTKGFAGRCAAPNFVFQNYIWEDVEENPQGAAPHLWEVNQFCWPCLGARGARVPLLPSPLARAKN